MKVNRGFRRWTNIYMFMLAKLRFRIGQTDQVSRLCLAISRLYLASLYLPSRILTLLRLLVLEIQVHLCCSCLLAETLPRICFSTSSPCYSSPRGHAVAAIA